MKKILIYILCVAFAFSSMVLGGCSDPGSPKTFSVSVTQSENGTVDLSSDTVIAGGNIVISFTPENGYILGELQLNGTAVDFEGNSYTLYNIVRDYEVKAVFVRTNVIISFSGDGCSELENISIVYGKQYGALPVPYASGKRFIAWKTSEGELITESSIVRFSENGTLHAVFSEIDEEYKESLRPFSATTVYHDAAAEKYGVVWHTEVQPVHPVIELRKDGALVSETECEYESWLGEYVVSGVLEGLSFDTEYSVRFGDKSADVWSDSYTFTTREETMETVDFFFVTDTKQTYRNENMEYESNGVGNIGTTYWQQVMREAVARFGDADFIAHGGNMVNYGIEPAYWAEMLCSVEEYLFRMPIMPVAGKRAGHTYYTTGQNVLDKLFNVEASDYNTSRGLFYSFDYGPLHFIALRSNDMYAEESSRFGIAKISDAQIDWLEQDLAEAKADTGIKWIVAMISDNPADPTITKYQSVLCNDLLPVFDEYGVDIVLSGGTNYLASTLPSVYKTGGFMPLNITLGTEIYEGENVAVFNYNGEERGTIYHQNGPAGSQYSSQYGNESDLAAGYRKLIGGGKGGFASDKAYSMYSYVCLSETELILRTYGVDVAGIAAAETNLTDYGVYLDGFKLSK